MYQGYFINLDRSEARRLALLQHLEQRNAASRYQRIEAIDARAVAQQYQTKLDPGSLGCWLSHAKAVKVGFGSKKHLHIIEDDTVFAHDAVNLFDELLDFADATLGGWDLIFTDICVVPADGRACADFLRAMKGFQRTKTPGILDLQNIYFASTSSYFVNWQSIEKYASLISNPEASELPIDVHIRGLVNQSKLKAYVTVPFLTTLADSLQSDISGQIDRSHAVFNAFRRAFFQDADLRHVDAELQGLLQGVVPSPLEMIYLKALLFTLSDEYVGF